MKRSYIILLLLGVSCGGHRVPALQSAVHAVDTVRVLPVAAADTVRPPGIHHPKDTVVVLPEAEWKTSVFTTDLNNDQVPDTITVVSTTSDTSVFNIMSIALAGFGKQTFHPPIPFTGMDDWFSDSIKNVIHTNKFFLAKGKSQSAILLFGYIDGAGYRDDFSIINIENNRAALVLNQNERHLHIEVPISLTDLDGDGRLDFLYRQIFEYNGGPDTLGGKIGTYSPYFVYTVDSSCVLNKALTISYNKEHYVFAGFRYDESIDVFYPNDGSKPRLWKK